MTQSRFFSPRVHREKTNQGMHLKKDSSDKILCWKNTWLILDLFCEFWTKEQSCPMIFTVSSGSPIINLHCAKYSSVTIRKFSLNELKTFVFVNKNYFQPFMKWNLIDCSFAVFNRFVDVSVIYRMNYSNQIPQRGQFFFFQPKESDFFWEMNLFSEVALLWSIKNK